MMSDQKIATCPRCGSLCTVGPRGTSNPKYPPDLHFRLECQGKKCGYGLEGDTEAEAISAHNAVSNAVATQPDLLDKLDRLVGAVHAFTNSSGWKVCDIAFLNDCAELVKQAEGEA